MATDYYVNVNGKKVLYSSLSSQLQKQLDTSGVTQTESAKQNITYTPTTTQDFYEKDYLIKQNTGEVSVPGRYVEQASRGAIKPPTRKEQRRLKKLEEERLKKEQEEEESQYGFLVHEYDPSTKKGSNKKKFSQLSDKTKWDVVTHVSPIVLASKFGILAPKENIAYKVKEGGKHSQSVYSESLQKNYEKYLLTGDVSGLNAYLDEIKSKEGLRAASKERRRLEGLGVEHLYLSGSYGGGGKGTRPQRLEKEAEQRRSSRILASGQDILYQDTFGQQVKGELGATFDERFPQFSKPKTEIGSSVEPYFVEKNGVLYPVQGPPKPTYVVEGKEFKTKAEAETYAKTLESKGDEVIIPLLPYSTPSSNQIKLPLTKALESTDIWLTDLARQKQEFLKRNPLLLPLDVLAVPIEAARITTQFVGGIENIKESLYAPIIGAQQTAPATFKKTTSDETVFPISITTEGIKLKTPEQIYKESKEYIQTFGGASYVGGLALTYGTGGAELVKPTYNLIKKGITKLKSVSVKTAEPSIKPAVAKIYPEIKTQPALTAKQVEQAQTIMKRVITKQQLAEKLYQPTIKTPLTDVTKLKSSKPLFAASQKDVRLNVIEQRNVKLDPEFKQSRPLKNIFKEDTTLAKPGDFIGPINPNRKPVKIVGKIITPNKEFKYKPIEKTLKSNSPEYDPLLQNKGIQPPLKRLGGTGEKAKIIKRKVDTQKLFSEDTKLAEPSDFIGPINPNRKPIKIIKDIVTPNKEFKYKPIEKTLTKEKLIEYDPLLQDRGIQPPLKRLGGTGEKAKTIKRKLDVQKLFGDDSALATSRDFIGPINPNRKPIKIVGDIKLKIKKFSNPPPIENVANKPKPVEYNPFTQDKGIRPPLKRLGGTGKKAKVIKRKVDTQKLLPSGTTEGVFQKTKVSLGKTEKIYTKTVTQKEYDDYISKLIKRGKKPRQARTTFEDYKPKSGERIIKSGGSVLIQKTKTEQIVKPKNVLKNQEKAKKILTEKRKRPTVTVWSEEKERVLPKTQSRSPTTLLVKPKERKKIKKKYQQVTSYQTSDLVTEEILLSKNRPQPKTQQIQKNRLLESISPKSKTRTLTGLKSFNITSTKPKLSTKQFSISATKPKIITKQKPKLSLKEKPILKTETKLSLKTKQKTLTKQKTKTPTPSRSKPKILTITKFKQRTPEKVKITTKNPPPEKVILLPPAVFGPPKPKRRRERKKSKKKTLEDFFGSTHEADILGWQKQDITYNKKKINQILASEQKLFSRSKTGSKKQVYKKEKLFKEEKKSDGKIFSTKRLNLI